MAVMSDDFTHRTFRPLSKRVHRLGLACNFGIDDRGMDAAFERGINYVYWTGMRTGHLKPRLRRELAARREEMILAATTTVGYFGFNVRSACETTLRELGVEYIDILILGWLGVGAAWTKGTIDALLQLKKEGKVRAIGTSIHNRVRAGQLAEDSELDLFMLRYNAAHPGAEREVFPHLEKRHPGVIAYTATSWRKLLKRPRGWDGPVMTAPDCYRFCLSNPDVDVVLTGPKTRAELEETLNALARGPLSDEELAWMRKFGAAVHG